MDEKLSSNFVSLVFNLISHFNTKFDETTINNSHNIIKRQNVVNMLFCKGRDEIVTTQKSFFKKGKTMTKKYVVKFFGAEASSDNAVEKQWAYTNEKYAHKHIANIQRVIASSQRFCFADVMLFANNNVVDVWAYANEDFVFANAEAA